MSDEFSDIAKHSEHMHGRARKTARPKSSRKKRPKRLRVDAEISSSLARSLEENRCKIGCDKSHLIQIALEAFVGNCSVEDGIDKLISARENKELRRLSDLGFFVLARMANEPLLLPPSTRLIDHCHAVAASHALRDIRMSLKEVLRLVATLWESLYGRQVDNVERPNHGMGAKTVSEGNAS